MDLNQLASGDNNTLPISPRYVEERREDDVKKVVENGEKVREDSESQDMSSNQEEITPQIIDDNEMKLKDRITQCRSIIESLKLELNEEKAKLETESRSHLPQTKYSHSLPETVTSYPTPYYEIATSDNINSAFDTNMYSACVDNKLKCDENLMEYEKQLQKYQNTLNMAQIEKKNAIRKQMLAKAYKLKLLEVENQCNIELLRVKQSLQCLEPLQMIANKWKSGSDSDSISDFNSYELMMPRYPELNATSMCDISSIKEGLEEKLESNCKNGSTSSEC